MFDDEIGDSWHSMGTYYFPSTVAFIDVLSQSSEGKVRRLKNVIVVANALPLHHLVDEGYYTTFFLNDALPIISRLRLDCLTMVNIWLEPNGEGVHGWCLSATHNYICQLLVSSG